MSACLILDLAPLGALIQYDNGERKPPSRFTKKLAAWKQANGVGRLVRKEPARERPTYTSPSCFTLHEGDFGERGVILVTVTRIYGIDSKLRFRVLERPHSGQIRVLHEVGGNVELVHLADNRESAKLWVAKAGDSHARLDEVSADEVAADVLEGRMTA